MSTDKKIVIETLFFDNENMIVLLHNKVTLTIPLSNIPEIQSLTSEQKRNFQVFDNEYISFVDIAQVYHVNNLIIR